jgi:hypothetical protein
VRIFSSRPPTWERTDPLSSSTTWSEKNPEILACRPVQQRRQLAGPLSRHLHGDLGADRRKSGHGGGQHGHHGNPHGPFHAIQGTQPEGANHRRRALHGSQDPGSQEHEGVLPAGIYERKRADRIVHVDDGEAFETARLLAKKEGLLVGMSAGAAMAVALKARPGNERGSDRGHPARRG